MAQRKWPSYPEWPVDRSVDTPYSVVDTIDWDSSLIGCVGTAGPIGGGRYNTLRFLTDRLCWHGRSYWKLSVQYIEIPHWSVVLARQVLLEAVGTIHWDSSLIGCVGTAGPIWGGRYNTLRFVTDRLCWHGRSYWKLSVQYIKIPHLVTVSQDLWRTTEFSSLRLESLDPSDLRQAAPPDCSSWIRRDGIHVYRQRCSRWRPKKLHVIHRPGFQCLS